MHQIYVLLSLANFIPQITALKVYSFHYEGDSILGRASLIPRPLFSDRWFLPYSLYDATYVKPVYKNDTNDDMYIRWTAGEGAVHLSRDNVYVPIWNGAVIREFNRSIRYSDEEDEIVLDTAFYDCLLPDSYIGPDCWSSLALDRWI